jgi:hypothetical protein
MRQPYAILLHGSDPFLAGGTRPNSMDSFCMTEINASTGALVWVISGPQYRFDIPTAMTADGTDLFVLNIGGSTVHFSVTVTETYATNLRGPPPAPTARNCRICMRSQQRLHQRAPSNYSGTSFELPAIAVLHWLCREVPGCRSSALNSGTSIATLAKQPVSLRTSCRPRYGTT